MSADHFFLTGKGGVDKPALLRRILQELQPLRTGEIQIGQKEGLPDLLVCYPAPGSGEDCAGKFFQKVVAALDEGIPILGVVEPEQPELLGALRRHRRVKLYEITPENCREMEGEILEAVRKKLWRQKTDSAGAIVVRREGSGLQVLLVKGKNGRWMFPKGHIRPGETEEEAAVRETREETGILIRITGGVAAEISSNRPGDRRRIRLYPGECIGGRLVPGIPEVRGADWFSGEQALELLQDSEGDTELPAVVRHMLREKRQEPEGPKADG
ncbi:MAG: NUDIX domain-containing protein [Bacillota bacterium]|nr:NUDIX domain-containing protein [Bacillota bacterium]